ncbi:MAG: c-type cytochrome [Terriglobia bacterium]
MKGFLTALILVVVLVPVAGYLYVRSGNVPVATSAPPMPMERMLAQTALHATLAKEAPKAVPITVDDAALGAGARVYRANCAMCHGLPGQAAPAAAKGMFPPAPQLFQPDEMVTDDPAGVTFWKAKNGIRLTGMPGFHASLSDAQLWQVSVLLAGADKLPAAVQTVLAPPAPDWNPPQ